MDKVIIIDQNNAHEDLGLELSKKDILLQHCKSVNQIEDEFPIYIVRIEKHDLIGEFLKDNRFRNRTIILSDDYSETIVFGALEMGCIDYIRYSNTDPKNIARRIAYCLEKLNTHEASNIAPFPNGLISFSLTEFINNEIKRSNRGKNPLAFVLAKLDDGATERDYTMVLNIMNNILRDTDTVTKYKDYIMLVLPFCDHNGLKIIKNRFSHKLKNYNLKFCNILKNKYIGFFSNERDVIFDLLEEKSLNSF